jgi:hypothetical protein
MGHQAFAKKILNPDFYQEEQGILKVKFGMNDFK